MFCNWLDVFSNFLWNDLCVDQIPILGDILVTIIECIWDLLRCNEVLLSS